MQFSTIFFFVAVAALTQAAAGMRISERDGTDPKVFCGTTEDATLSDCQALVQPDTWNAAWAAGSNVCHYTNGLNFNEPAYNVACHGNCCAYYANGFRTQANFDSESIRGRAASLLGCGDTAKNSINGLQVTPVDGSGVCLSDGNGCGDCFDDSDFASA
ncbi:hypothetical protein PsYK624_072900 [Phanerochaete sordida]|uniref:Uncharacterized protein n=1 Tax=Phanerochaete sordida TaxID=48140 RepID=A0A9P3GAC9_9APHY|nr:hypothetical protein PsYK624_072900 [Phanerochaete sordida]